MRPTLLTVASRSLRNVASPAAARRAALDSLRREVRHSPAGGLLGAVEIARNPVRYLAHNTTGGRFVKNVAGMMSAGASGDTRRLASELAGEEVRHLVGTVQQYALGRGNVGRMLIRNLGPIGSAIDFLLGRVKNLRATANDIEAARRILEAAGYGVTPPQMGPGDAGQADPPGGSYDVGGAPPAAGGGMGGRIGRGGRIGGGSAPPPRQPGQVTQGPRVPVGTFPGGLYVPMSRVSSSNVYAIGYDPATLTMRVQYLATSINASALRGRGHRGKNRVRGARGKTLSRHKSGAGPVYDYHGVPKRVFNRIASASSTGGAIWTLLRVRGTIYGHRYDYELIASSRTAVIAMMPKGYAGPPKRVGVVTYVPRKATGPGHFEPRRIRQGSQIFRSLLPKE